MSKRTWPACACLALCGIAGISSAFAQSTHDKAIKAAQVVEPLGLDVGGELVNYYSGSTSFKATDLSIPGNSSLPVAISRIYSVEPERMLTASGTPHNASYTFDRAHLFGDWDLDIPHIAGTFSAGTFGSGWVLDSTTPLNRCSVIGQVQGNGSPATGQPPPSDYHWVEEFFTGYTLHAGGDSKVLLVADVAGVARPSSGGPYHWTTTNRWWVSCLPGIQNGTGQGYLAISPDGTKYYFDWMSSRTVAALKETIDLGDDKFRDFFTYTKEFRMLPSKVVDRFGNWVEYTYSADEFARLLSITANDGRTITLHYNALGHVTSATGGNRTVAYTYRSVFDGKSLAQVVLPDDSTWEYDFTETFSRQILPTGDYGQESDFCGQQYPPHGNHPPIESYECVGWPEMGLVGDDHPTISVKTPSGATVQYTFGLHYQLMGEGGYMHGYPLGLDAKTISGAGMTPQTWQYVFGSNAQSTKTQCLAGACPITIWTDEIGPDNSVTRRTFGLGSQTDHGLLRRQSRGTMSGQGTPSFLRVEDYDYHLGASVGHSPGSQAILFTVRNIPVETRAIQQQGRVFQRHVDSWDAFDRELQVTSSSTATKTDTIEYHDDTALWVLGQVERTTTKGPSDPVPVEASRTDYGWKALPSKTYSFGKLQQTLTYNTNGTVATVKDGNNKVTTLSNWKRGVPQRIQFPDTTEIAAVANDNGWITSTTDENGYKTCYGYDDAGRLSQVTYPSESSPGTCNTSTWAATYRTFSFVTAEYGLPTHWRLWERTGNGYKVIHYDALRRPVVEDTYDFGDVDDTRSIVVKRYDAAGRLAFQSYPMRTLDNYAAVTWGTRTNYDTLDRVTRVEQDSELGDLVTTTEYLAGFQTRVTNPRGFATTTSYLAYDTPSTDWPVAITHPEGAYTSIVRDVFGKPTALSRRNADSSVWNGRYYAYDQFQRLCKLSEPETGTNAMGYDNAGNLLWSASGQTWSPTGACLTPEAVAARRVDREYDARNRLLAMEFPDGQGDQYWSYTPDGLPAQVSTFDAGQETINAYTYNKRRMLTGEAVSQLYGWGTWSLGYGYNANGHLSVQVYPGGMTIPYAPNALGQATQAGSFATGVSRYSNGAIHQFNYGNGIAYNMIQNTRQLPAWTTATNQAMHYSYNYDKNANVTVINDDLGSGPERTMTYDGLDRLKTAASPMWGGTLTYGYDQLDNLTTLTGAGRNLRYCYNDDKQLTFVRSNATTCSNGAAVHALDYDVQGNLDSKDQIDYQFDVGNRLREVVGKETYRYDALGRRVRATSPDGDIISVYSHGGQLMFQQDYRRNINSNYVYLDGSLVAIQEIPIGGGPTTFKYQHTDALGSPVTVTSSTGAVLERFKYEPYGQRIGGALQNGPGYTGHVLDAETGLNYMQQRYYDPMIGRFLSVDPVTANSTTGSNFNRYWYAANNPYKFVDPDGRANKLGITAKIDEYSEAHGQTLTDQDQAALDAAQRSVDLTVNQVSASGTPEQKSSLQNWTVTVDPRVDAAPGTTSGMAGTLYIPAADGEPEVISTVYAGTIVKAANPQMTNSSNGMVATGGDASLLMVGAHEFAGHGNAANAAIPPGPANENDARTRTWNLINGTPGVTCEVCEQ